MNKFFIAISLIVNAQNMHIHAAQDDVSQSAEYKRVNTKNKKGQTALMLAANAGALGAVQALLGCNETNPCETDNEGRTATYYAQTANHGAIARLLQAGEAQYSTKLAAARKKDIANQAKK